MPATRAAMERHYTEDDRGMGETCPECGGDVYLPEDHLHRWPCRTCDGTGAVSPERAAEDAWDTACDEAYERAGDR